MQIKYSQRLGDTNNLRVVRAASEFILPKLFTSTNQIKGDIRLINFSPHINGDCYLDSRDQNKFHIRLNRHLPCVDLISTLAHECIHARQFINKELSVEFEENIETWYWNGNKYRFDIKSSNYHSMYYNSPWEVEARAEETKLALEYFQHELGNVARGHFLSSCHGKPFVSRVLYTQRLKNSTTFGQDDNTG